MSPEPGVRPSTGSGESILRGRDSDDAGGEIETTERKWSQEARQLGEEHLAGLLNEYRASWALIRQWAGYDAAVAERGVQIQKLESLVWDAVYALQKAGQYSEAVRLRRAIEPRPDLEGVWSLTGRGLFMRAPRACGCRTRRRAALPLVSPSRSTR